MNFKYANRFSTTLTANLTTGGLSMTVASITNAPTISTDEYTILKLTRLSDSAVEYIKIAVAISSTTITIDSRAQEGTTALALVIGDRVEGEITKGLLDALISDYESQISSVTAVVAQANQLATDASALAQSALDLAGRFPVQTVDIGDGQVTSAKLASTVAGVALAFNGVGGPLDVQYDTAMFEIVANAIALKNNVITQAKMNGGKIMQYDGNTEAIVAPGNTASFITTASTPANSALFFGNAGSDFRLVMAVLRNDHVSAAAVVTVYVGSSLGHWDGTGSEVGIPFYDQIKIGHATSLNSTHHYVPIMFPVPQGSKWMFYSQGTGTPRLWQLQFMDIK